MEHLTDLQILQFLIEVTALLITSRVLAEIMRRVGQPDVIGELLAGVLIGPSILGHFAPAAYQFIFPSDPTVGHLLEAFAWIGALTLLLYIGLETDLSLLRGLGRTVVVISSFGIIVPLAGGAVLGLMLPARYLVDPSQRTVFALFMGVALSITAVPLIAKVLLDLGLMRRELGVLVLAAGIVDDILGWVLLSIVAGIIEVGVVRFSGVVWLLLATGGFLGFCYFIGYRIVTRLLRWVDDYTYIAHAKITAILSVAFLCAIATQAIGIHAVFGSFVAGLMLAGSARVRKADRADLEAITTALLAPIFFAYSGLKADLSTLQSPLVPVLVIAVACLTKLVGCGVAALLSGLGWRQASAIAAGMNARGEMGVIVALLGMNLGVLNQEMYTVFLLVAVLTSIMTPPLMSWAVTGLRETTSEAERQNRERIMSRLPFQGSGARLLVLSGSGPNSDLVAHMAAALARHPESSVTIFHAAAAQAAGSESDDFGDRIAHLKAIAQHAGATSVLSRTQTGESVAEVILSESARGYDAIFVGASQQDGRDDLGGDVLRSLVASARAPIIIVRSASGAVPFKRVLTPTTGAWFSLMGATVAIQYAHAFDSHVTALHVQESELLSLPALGLMEPAPSEGNEFVRTIQELGEHLGVNVEARVSSGRRPANVIVKAVERDNADLLVMGVLFRSSDERLFFGPKVRRILEAARCAVVVVVPPEPATFRS